MTCAMEVGAQERLVKGDTWVATWASKDVSDVTVNKNKPIDAQ